MGITPPGPARVRPAPLENASLLAALDGAMGLYHGETARHCGRVSRLATRIGVALHLDRVELEALAWAGLLHDLGKLSVPAHVLGKLGPLDESDWVEIKRHPVVGGEMMLAISPDSERIASGIRAHHERWDGSGYPDGLAGEEIPLLGRIITLPDVFDAMTNTRPYRGHVWSDEEAIDEIQRAAGTHFDPDIVPVFLALHRRDHAPFRGTHHPPPPSATSSPREHLATSLAFLSPFAGAARGGQHAQGRHQTTGRAPVPSMDSPTRMQLTRVAVVAALAGAATSLLAVVAFTALIDQGSASGADTTPAIVVHPHDASATNRPLSTATAGLAPGDTRESVVHLETNDHTGLAGIALTTTAKPDSAITTDTVEGLQMLIERCSVAWTHVPDTTPSHYACEGETRTVLAETPVVVTNRILTHVDLSAGADNFLRVTLSLPHRAGDHLGAEKTVIDWAFAATRGKAQE